jgi:hypothetical protein
MMGTFSKLALGATDVPTIGGNTMFPFSPFCSQFFTTWINVHNMA